jgi:prephenate dehydratase
MALENPIAGSIIPNYALIDNHNLYIIGEEYLNIHHHLMTLEGQRYKTLKKFHHIQWHYCSVKQFLKKISAYKISRRCRYC